MDLGQLAIQHAFELGQHQRAHTVFPSFHAQSYKFTYLHLLHIWQVTRDACARYRASVKCSVSRPVLWTDGGEGDGGRRG